MKSKSRSKFNIFDNFNPVFYLIDVTEKLRIEVSMPRNHQISSLYDVLYIIQKDFYL